MSKMFLSYRHTKPDDDLATFLYKKISARKHKVFIDRQMLVGTKWVEEINRQLRSSDFLVVLLSEESIRSDMVREEIKIGYNLSRKKDRHPKFMILPVRVAFTGELPYDLASYLDGIQYELWKTGMPFDTIADHIIQAIEQHTALSMGAGTAGQEASPEAMKELYAATEGKGAPLPQADPRFSVELEDVTGTMKLESPFYIRRTADDEMETEAIKPGATIVVKGPRQMGKSSILARTQALCKNSGFDTLFLDLQLLDEGEFESLDALLRSIARRICRVLKTTASPDDVWDNRLGAKENFKGFIEEACLVDSARKFTLLVDEIDIVYKFPFRDDFFSAIRCWHNLRATEKMWDRFNIIIAHSTDPYLWIQDVNQSPFNVGRRMMLEEFQFEHVQELNQRHANPLRCDDEICSLMNLVGGHPFLIRQALYIMASKRCNLSQFQKAVLKDTGPFGDHLKRFISVLSSRQDLQAALRAILRRNSCDDEMAFQRLRAAGLIAGETRTDAHMRCQLYSDYFKKHL